MSSFTVGNHIEEDNQLLNIKTPYIEVVNHKKQDEQSYKSFKLDQTYLQLKAR